MSTPKSAPAPKRNPTEKLVVRGAIIVMLAIVGYEAWGHFGIQQAESALTALQAKVDDAGASAEAGVTEREVHDVLKRKPEGGMQVFNETRANGAKAVEKYVFPGLIRPRVLYVYYGVEGTGTKEEHKLRDMLVFTREEVKQTQWEKMQEDQKKLGVSTEKPPARSEGPGVGGGGAGPGGGGGAAPPGGGMMKTTPPPGYKPGPGDWVPGQKSGDEAKSEEKSADEPKADEPEADEPKANP